MASERLLAQLEFTAGGERLAVAAGMHHVVIDFLFFHREKLGVVVEFGEDFLVQVEVLVPDVGQGGLQRGPFTQGLDLLPATVARARRRRILATIRLPGFPRLRFC